MGKALTMERIFDTLIEQEQKGYQFYAEAAGSVQDSEAKALFERFAKDEVEHEQTYLAMRERHRYDAIALSNRLDEAYVELLISDYDLEPRRVRGKVWTKQAALQVAEGMERSTILFVSELISFGLAEAEPLKKVLQEERAHLATILQYKQGPARGPAAHLEV